MSETISHSHLLDYFSLPLVASNSQADAVKGWSEPNCVHHDHSQPIQVQCGIMPNLQYSNVHESCNFMNLSDLQDLISPACEEDSAWIIPYGSSNMEKDQIKNVQYSSRSSPLFADDTASRISSNCDAKIKWSKNKTEADVHASNPAGKRRVGGITLPIARVQGNNNGESKRLRISWKDFLLPQGWITWKQERLNGKSAGNKDAHYMELSTKKRFRSRVEVRRYLQNKEQAAESRTRGTEVSLSSDDVHERKALSRKKLQVRRQEKNLV